MRIKDFFELLKSAAFKWSEHNAPRLGAALAYYMLLSLAPLLIIVVAICGLVFSEATVKQQVLMQVRTLAGAAGENSVSMLIENAHRPQNGALATFIAILTLLSGASGVFTELRESLNTIRLPLGDQEGSSCSPGRDRMLREAVPRGFITQMSSFE